MSAFALDLGPHVDPEALRRALARCARPLLVERRDATVRLVVEDADARALRARWLRAGLVAIPAPEWPPAESEREGAVAAGGRWWCLARVTLAHGHALPDAVLRLAPVDPADAARAIVGALRPRWWSLRRRRAPRALARSCARVLARLDGVVSARAFVLVDGPTPHEARARLASSVSRPRPVLVRTGVVDAWESFVRGVGGGVWRLLSDLEPWWRA